MVETWPLVPLAPSTIALLLAASISPDESLNDIAARLCRSNAAPRPIAKGTSLPPPHYPRQVSFEFLGKPEVARNAIEALVWILRELQKREPTFLERLELAVRGRKRNKIARTPALVHPNRPDLAAQSVVQLVPGWFLDTNLANRDKITLLEEACRSAGLVFGRDLRIELQVT